MAKNAFLDWSETASNNTDIGGVGILGTNAVSNFDDAFRTLMAQLRAGVDGEVVYAVKAGNYTALANDNNAVHRYTAAATVTLTAAATLAANWHYTVIADGADVTIDPNGAETIDGAATLILANGSTARIICNGTSFYTEKSLSKIQPFASIASAATTDLSTVGSQNVLVTGTTTITALGTAPSGTFRRLRFSGALTLTYNATSLILPGSVNIATAANDVAEMISLGSGNWFCSLYQPAARPGISSSSVATTSGTTVDFTGIPSTAKRVTLNLFGVSTNGTSDIVVQVGTSGGVEATSYSGSISRMGAAAVVSVGATGVNFATIVNNVGSAEAYYGRVVFENVSGNQWVINGSVGTGNDNKTLLSLFGKTTGAALDRVRLTTAGGANTFDAGTASVSWEN